MPINIPDGLPARRSHEERIFALERGRRAPGDRPLRVAILNLMPTKIETETQILPHLQVAAAGELRLHASPRMRPRTSRKTTS